VNLKTLVLPLAASALIIVGAGAVLATAGPLAPAQVAAPAADPTPTPAPAATAKPGKATASPFLAKVLDGLVAKGTITAAQEQAILDAWTTQRTSAMTQRRADRQQLKTFLSDGVLTAAELAQLPADSPLQQLKPLMKNGQLTVDELRALGRGILNDLRLGGKGMGRGGGLGGRFGLPSPSASPATGG
jgi:Spy/CpxP family protein refolding chaperone